MNSVLNFEQETVKGATSSGFAFEVDPAALSDMELVDALADLNDGNALALSKVCTILFGKEQKKALYDHFRTQDGRVPAKDVEQAATEVFKALGTYGKNS